MQELIKELQEADATLEKDGYKSWCYTRLAIAKAIEVLQKPILNKANVMQGGTPEPLAVNEQELNRVNNDAEDVIKAMEELQQANGA